MFEKNIDSPTSLGNWITEKQGSGKTLTWVGVTGGLLCAALVLGVVYLILKWLTKKQSKPSPQETEQLSVPIIRLSAPQPSMSNASSMSSLTEIFFQQEIDTDRLDPNMYLTEEEERVPGSPFMGPGRICFHANYDIFSEKLKVKLIRATRLSPKGENVTVTPYVKICLLPDKRQRVQSRVRRRTSNPEFFEDFVFIIQEKDLHKRTLKFTVCDYDRFSRQQVIGHVFYPLTDTEALMSEESNEIWMDLSEEDPKVTFPKGDILFCLQFLPNASRLTIAILKARNLKIEGEFVEMNPYVKVSMIIQGKTYKKKKTGICRRTCDPVYNEAFVFTIPPACLDRVSFVISVINAPRLRGTKKLIGRSVVGPYMYSTGEGLEHWTEMLNSARRKLARWHSLI